MGIVTVANFCSHLQNAAVVKLGMTSVTNTKYNLLLALALHRQGLISSVARGGPSPPNPDTLLTNEPQIVTHSNVSTRRLWIGLKYWENRPILRRLNVISRPTRLVNEKLPALVRISQGQSVRYVRGLNMGECIFLSTDVGILEIREAIDLRRGGLLLCRVGP